MFKTIVALSLSSLVFGSAVERRTSCTPAATPLVGVAAPLAAPTQAVRLSQSLLSFSIEGDRWTDWIGTTSPNTFWLNALNNLQAITGAPPKIRIGANSEDKTTFNPSIEFAVDEFPAPTTTVPYPEASAISVGPGYYQVAQFLPSGTHVTWGLNLGADNITNAVDEAKSLIQAFQSSAMKSAGVTLDLIEIGNEADLYVNNGLRQSPWTVATYVQQWTAFAGNVSQAIGMKVGTAPGFQMPSFANSDFGHGGFSPESTFSDGILKTTPGSMVTMVSQHHYSGSFCAGTEGILQDLMSKANIRGNLTQFTPDIQSTHAQGLPYTFGETNSYACHGAPGVSNTAGAALWALDYALQAATLGIQEVFFHEGIGFKYNFLQPIALNRSIIDGSAVSPPTPPHVQPAYYAGIIIAEGIGSTGSSQIVEFEIPSSIVAGYGFYEGGNLVRAVFINSLSWPSTSTGTRPSVNVSTLFLAASGAPTTATLKRLTIPFSDSTSGLTFGGQSYETSNALVSGTVQTQTVNLITGFTLSATEAVLVTF